MLLMLNLCDLTSASKRVRAGRWRSTGVCVSTLPARAARRHARARGPSVPGVRLTDIEETRAAL